LWTTQSLRTLAATLQACGHKVGHVTPTSWFLCPAGPVFGAVKNINSIISIC
jgi:hypothetical protein